MNTIGRNVGQITEDYVSLETAKLLKEKGFDEYYPFWYNLDKPLEGPFFYKEIGWYGHNSYSYVNRNIISAPTLQMVMKWLREVHKLHIDVDPSEGDWNPTVITLEDWTCAEKFGDNIPIQDSYEKACEAGIKYCLENLI